MEMTYSRIEGAVPVTVLSLNGDLDGSSYQDVIAAAQTLYQQGTRDMVLDLSNVPYMSSAGIVALQTIASVMRGEAGPDPEMGWAALHAVEMDQDIASHRHLKLLNPQPRVDQVLETVGLKSAFEVYPDLDSALASF